MVLGTIRKQAEQAMRSKSVSNTPPWSLLSGLFLSFSFSRKGFFVQSWLSWNLLYRPGWPQTHRDPPTSASPVLGLKECASTAWLCTRAFYISIFHTSLKQSSATKPSVMYIVGPHCELQPKGFSQMHMLYVALTLVIQYSLKFTAFKSLVPFQHYEQMASCPTFSSLFLSITLSLLPSQFPWIHTP